jgi:hypothetical protein
MLDALIPVVAALLVIAGILVMIGPQARALLRRLRAARSGLAISPGSRPARQRDAVPPGLNSRTQRVLVSATRLSTWLRAHGQDEVAREIRAAAARLATDEPSGLYAMQTALRRLRALDLQDRNAAERLRVLAADLRKAVQDRFEQLELLPFGRS